MRARCGTLILMVIRLLAVLSAVYLVMPEGEVVVGSVLLAADLQADFRDETVTKVADMVEEGYVDPEMGRRLADHLRQSLSDGKYLGIDSGAQLADELTRELRAMSADSHFRVVYAPPSSPLPANGTVSEKEPPEVRRERRLVGLRRENFGFKSIRQMAGNVFYVKLDSFMDPELAGDTAVSAMNFISNADAIVIDLRDNRGGDPRMVQFLASYFLASPVSLTGLYWRSIDAINQYWTLPHVAGKRMLDVDLYILTSRRTFSAAEAFAYDMKTLKRATIVGETTVGGANPIGRRQKVNERFRIDLPIGKAVSPVTQTNWEGVGVEPDIKTSDQEALERAHRTALDKILADAEPERVNEIAYEILNEDRLREAIELFRMNVRKHPQYANGYDSLGEALAKAGDMEAAAAAYRRALELDPSLSSSAEALARIEGD